jgi:hypothetical protein
MKQKFYSMYGTAVDRFGEEHIVTIVGEYTQEKVETEVTKEVDMEDDFKPTRMVKAKITYPTKIKIRTLTYAVSICHPDDEYDEEIGVEIAKRRICEKPMGQLTTSLVTTLCEDQIKLILFGELNYVINNIDRFINENY